MKKLFFVVVFALLAGCLPFNAPAPPPEVPGLVETIAAATYQAIASQTAAVLPTATPTPQQPVTPTKILPTETATVTPTPTPTFIILQYSPTPFPTSSPWPTYTSAPPAATSTPTNFSCSFEKQSPPNGKEMNPRNDFDWRWTINNNGAKDWAASEMQYLYIKGDKFHKNSSYFIPSDVPAGESVELIVDMEAPKQPGSYFTTWALQKGKTTFCYITLQIRVK